MGNIPLNCLKKCEVLLQMKIYPNYTSTALTLIELDIVSLKKNIFLALNWGGTFFFSSQWMKEGGSQKLFVEWEWELVMINRYNLLSIYSPLSKLDFMGKVWCGSRNIFPENIFPGFLYQRVWLFSLEASLKCFLNVSPLPLSYLESFNLLQIWQNIS